MNETEPGRIVLVRATVNLTGFRAGETRLVDADHPAVAALLDSDLLVVVADAASDADG